MSMRWWIVLAAAWISGCGEGVSKDASGKPVARWHSVGGAALRQQAGAPQLRAALTHPDVTGVGGRLATNVARFLDGKMHGAPDASRASRLVPLVDAALEHESLGEVTTGGWHLAVRVPPAVAAKLAEAAAHLRGDGSATVPSTMTTNGWFLAASDQAGISRAWKATGRPVAGFMEGELDLPKILGPGNEAWPAVAWGIYASNNLVRTSAKLSFATPPLGEPGPWKVPDGAIRDPILRFQAIRGAGPLVEGIGWMKALAGGAAPSQMFGWAQPKNVFRNWVAFPVEKPEPRLEKVYADIRPLFGSSNAPGRYEGRLVMATNHAALAVVGLKACQPALLSYQQGGQSFLIASLAPTLASTNPFPAELLAQIQKPSLMAYEWEITGESFLHWNVGFDFHQMAQRKAPFPTSAAARRWFMALAPSLGNSVTELLRGSPTEYTLLRKSDIGLDGLEMALLSRWLDAPYGFMPGLPPLPPVPTAAP